MTAELFFLLHFGVLGILVVRYLLHRRNWIHYASAVAIAAYAAFTLSGPMLKLVGAQERTNLVEVAAVEHIDGGRVVLRYYNHGRQESVQAVEVTGPVATGSQVSVKTVHYGWHGLDTRNFKTYSPLRSGN
jgi:hypothetical protein